jgi:uncharacterized membrane protein YfcA
MHMAIATSLAAMIFTTIASSWAHNKRKAVLWPVFKKMVPGLVLGSILGAVIAIWLSGIFLELIFGVFLCTLAWRFYRQKSIEPGSQKLPSISILSAWSTCIGALSILLGIGGGSLTVPLLTYYKVQDRHAIGTSSATTLLTTILGTIAYLVFGWGEIASPEMIGLINIPAFLIIGGITLFTAPIGARLTHEISPEKVRKIFAIILALTGISLII